LRLLLGKGHGLSLMSLELLSGKEILRLPLEEHSLRLLLRLPHGAEIVYELTNVDGWPRQ
jgi:hypothetical protein